MTGTKRRMLTDGTGIPVSVVISGSERHDMKKPEALLDTARVPYPEDHLDQPERPLALDQDYAYDAGRQTIQAPSLHIPNPTGGRQDPAPDTAG